MGTGVQGDDVGGGERAAGLTVPASRPPWARLCPLATAPSPHPDPPGKAGLALCTLPSCRTLARWTPRPVLGIRRMLPEFLLSSGKIGRDTGLEAGLTGSRAGEKSERR